MHCISPYSSVFYSRIKTFISRIQLCFVHRSQKRCLFCDVFLLCKDISNMSQKDVFSVTSPRRLKNISPNLLWFFKNTPRKWFRVISVGLLKYLIKYITHMTSRKIVQLRPPPPPPPFPYPPSSPNDNQSIQRKHDPRMTIICCQILPSRQLSFSCLDFLLLLFI